MELKIAGQSIFEILMLVCFGAAWPFSIYRSYSTKCVTGKSLVFLVVIFLGYVSGVCFKLFHHYDQVIWLYSLNGTMVLVDIALYLKYRKPVLKSEEVK